MTGLLRSDRTPAVTFREFFLTSDSEYEMQRIEYLEDCVALLFFAIDVAARRVTFRREAV